MKFQNTNQLAVYTLSLLCFVFCFTSCTRDLELDSDHQPKLGINAMCTPDSNWSIYVFQTRELLDLSNDFDVTDAKVTLKNQTNGLEFDLEHTGNGIYSAGESKPYIDHDYRIDVSAPGFKSIHAKTHIPKKSDFIVEEIDSLIEGLTEKFLRVRFTDDNPEENFYIIQISQIVETVEDEDPGTGSVNPEGPTSGKENEQAKNFSNFIDEDDLDNGKFSTSWNKEDLEGMIGSGGSTSGNVSENEYLIKVMSVTKDLYQYLKLNDIHDFTAPKNTSSTSIGVHSNVVHGKGVFGAFYQYQEKVKL